MTKDYSQDNTWYWLLGLFLFLALATALGQFIPVVHAATKPVTVQKEQEAACAAYHAGEAVRGATDTQIEAYCNRI